MRPAELRLAIDGGEPVKKTANPPMFPGGLAINDIVVNNPDGSVGGSLVLPSDREKYLARLRQTMLVAKKLGCLRLITCAGNTLPGVPREQQHRAVVETLKQGAQIAAEEGITLCLEPLNSLVDHAGYYLDSGHEAAEIVQEVSSPGLRLLWDVYHMQIMHGNVLANIRKYLPVIGHFHSAGVPGRHELNVGELNYSNILAEIKAWGYEGCFGLEYSPALKDHAASLAGMRRLTSLAGWD
jgi:hydroxypyruvate isomerase